MIIGIAGTIGAGKGSVVAYLTAKGFVRYSSSQTLGEIVEKEGNPKTRAFLGPVATRLQQEYKGGVVEKNYREKYEKEKPDNAIFEAIHRQSEANFLRSIGATIIGVDADLHTRYERTKLRNEGDKDRQSFEDFKEMSRVEDEGGGDKNWDNNIREVLTHADAVITNNGTLEELHSHLEQILQRIYKEAGA